jgi:FAD/FMN-containing dehydrogenase
MGAGVVASDAASYFNQFGLAVTVGACPSVGIAGGFGQTGGHGIYSRAYGLMVDNAGMLSEFSSHVYNKKFLISL